MPRRWSKKSSRLSINFVKKLLIFLALIAGCAGLAIGTGAVDKVVEWRVETALIDAGLSEKRASCMAGRMVDRLTIAQLLKLRSGMAPQEGEPESPKNLGDYIKRVRRIGDAEVVTVTVSSAGLCAIGIG